MTCVASHLNTNNSKSLKYTSCSYQWLYLVFVQIRSPKHKKVPVVCYITNQTGLARLKSSSVKALWVSTRLISLSGDVEKNPGPTNQNNENINANNLPVANTVSLLNPDCLKLFLATE